MRIGEFSKRLGLTPPTVRFYESLGLTAPAPRVSGSRRYDERALQRVRMVLALKRAGFTLGEIKELLGNLLGDRGPKRWQAAADEKLLEIDRSIEALHSARAILEKARECHCEGEPDRCAVVSNASDL